MWLPLWIPTLVILAVAGGGVAGGAGMDAKTLMHHMDRLYRSDSSHARMTMRVRTAHYERTMTMEAWSKGKEKSLVVILAPKKDRGVATLKVGKNIWNWLPKIGQQTKVPSSMMMGSWMGSHFTNDDLIAESSLEEDYNASITYQGPRGGKTIYEVTLSPKPDAPVVWGKLVMEIEQITLLPLKSLYYDEDQMLVRTMVYLDVRSMGGRNIPVKMVLTPEGNPEESTTVVYEDMRFDLPLEDRQFSLQALRTKR
ncbi:MAG: outer membrane lipoprotein-sorting protein [Deltaproteobacteria bacterium]|nr:outer membrane lipoprotein-sorting protein [Deltaproteobacteria bacterium]